MTLNNLAVLYADKNEYPAAEAIVFKLISIYKRLRESKTQIYSPKLANAYGSLSWYLLFEKRFAEYLGMKHVLFTNSCTIPN